MSVTFQDKSLTDSRNPRVPTITVVGLAGFKSFAEPTSAEVRPLTLLAGANSSGKSSLLQPLLLLKQTLDVTFDPGPLKLDGPNVTFTSVEQILSRVATDIHGFAVIVNVNDSRLQVVFDQESHHGLAVKQFDWSDDGAELSVNQQSSAREISSQLLTILEARGVTVRLKAGEPPVPQLSWQRFVPRLVGDAGIESLLFQSLFTPFLQAIRSVIHVAGLRGNPLRTYRRTGTGPLFPGTFETYVATVLHDWQQNSREMISCISAALQELGLTWKVIVTEFDQTQLEIGVGRLIKPARGGAHDVVNIADVGFGVSQVLPVVVALHAAQPGQLVFIEQPELHLHPRAQGRMATLLADAAKRGVRVVAETHSQELLLGVQTLVAEGKLDPALVKLHWFERGPDGCSSIINADLDESGAFGDWPVDFADVSLTAESRYLDAAESRVAERATP